MGNNAGLSTINEQKETAFFKTHMSQPKTVWKMLEVDWCKTNFRKNFACQEKWLGHALNCRLFNSPLSIVPSCHLVSSLHMHAEEKSKIKPGCKVRFLWDWSTTGVSQIFNVTIQLFCCLHIWTGCGLCWGVVCRNSYTWHSTCTCICGCCSP